MSFKDWFKSKEVQEVVQEVKEVVKEEIKERLSAPADPKSAPGDRIYHEYFVPEQAVNGIWPWTARVYGRKGAVIESNGNALYRKEACLAAIDWATKTKEKLRGVATS